MVCIYTCINLIYPSGVKQVLIFFPESVDVYVLTHSVLNYQCYEKKLGFFNVVRGFGWLFFKQNKDKLHSSDIYIMYIYAHTGLPALKQQRIPSGATVSKVKCTICSQYMFLGILAKEQVVCCSTVSWGCILFYHFTCCVLLQPFPVRWMVIFFGHD